jgi:hypothetical protein
MQTLGFLAREAQLNDVVLLFALRQMAADFRDVYVVDPLRVVAGAKATPTYHLPLRPLSDIQLVVFPLHFFKIHWCVICVVIENGKPVRAILYDHLQKGYEDKLQRASRSDCLLFLKRWMDRDGEEMSSYVRIDFAHRVWQHDSTSCGVYGISLAHSFMIGTVNDENEVLLTPHSTESMRIGVMWRMFCTSIVTDDAMDKAKWMDSLESLDRFASKP